MKYKIKYLKNNVMNRVKFSIADDNDHLEEIAEKIKELEIEFKDILSVYRLN